MDRAVWMHVVIKARSTLARRRNAAALRRHDVCSYRERQSGELNHNAIKRHPSRAPYMFVYSSVHTLQLPLIGPPSYTQGRRG